MIKSEWRLRVSSLKYPHTYTHRYLLFFSRNFRLIQPNKFLAQHTNRWTCLLVRSETKEGTDDIHIQTEGIYVKFLLLWANRVRIYIQWWRVPWRRPQPARLHDHPAFRLPFLRYIYYPLVFYPFSTSPRRSFVRRYRENDVRWKTGFVCSIPNGTVFCFWTGVEWGFRYATSDVHLLMFLFVLRFLLYFHHHGCIETVAIL